MVGMCNVNKHFFSIVAFIKKISEEQTELQENGKINRREMSF